MIYNTIVFDHEIDSTLAQLARRVAQDDHLPSPTVLIAPGQTAGRGQGTHSWYSTSGCNLLPTIFWRHSLLRAQDVWSLSEAVALAVYQAYAEYLPADRLRIKWPNDLFYDQYKIAGILIQNSWVADRVSHSLIGVGMNINEPHFPDTLPHATSLRIAMGTEVDPQRFLDTFLSRLAFWVSCTETLADRTTMHHSYLNQLFLRNQTTLFEERATGLRFEGKIVEVDLKGNMHIARTDGSVACYAFSEISYVLYQNPMQ